MGKLMWIIAAVLGLLMVVFGFYFVTSDSLYESDGTGYSISQVGD